MHHHGGGGGAWRRSEVRELLTLTLLQLTQQTHMSCDETKHAQADA